MWPGVIGTHRKRCKHVRGSQGDTELQHATSETASSDFTDPWPTYPSENPSTDASRLWIDTWRASIRAGGYEAITNDDPVRPSELRHKTALAVPAVGGGVTENAVASMQAKNAEIVAINAARDAQWVDHLRSERDRFAGKLERAMMSSAPQRWATLKAAHAYAPPNDEMLNGRAIFLALSALTICAHARAEDHPKPLTGTRAHVCMTP